MTAIGAGGTWAVAQRTPAASPDAPWTRIEEAVVDVLVGSPDFSPIPARKGGN
jgi:hypothetical protein